MKFGYYPGCSLHSTASEYDLSLRLVCKALGIELVEPKKWLCCGSTPAHAISHLLSIALPWQNLLAFKKLDLSEVLVPCASCFSRFKIAQYEVKNNPELKKEIERIIGRSLLDEVKIQHPLAVFSQGNFLDAIKNKRKKDLSGMKVACYYGCLLTRPPKAIQFDECEYPMTMDRVLQAAGLTTLDWSYKTDCCGAAFSLTQTEVVLKLCSKILAEAKAVGAEGIAVACPLCQANLDMRQEETEKAYQEKFGLPIFYFTQLIGLAMGISPRELGLNKHLVSVKEMLEKCQV